MVSIPKRPDLRRLAATTTAFSSTGGVVTNCCDELVDSLRLRSSMLVRAQSLKLKPTSGMANKQHECTKISAVTCWSVDVLQLLVHSNCMEPIWEGVESRQPKFYDHL